MKFLIVFVVFLAVTSAHKRQRCFPVENANQCKKAFTHYETCGTACPKTCDNYNKPIICTKQCVEGCFCDKGYVLDKNNNCILIEDCPVSSVCGANEEYSECGGHRCVNFCRDPTFSWRCRPACTPGCACKEGYLRDEDDSCVLPVDCSVSPTCPANEIYSFCNAHECHNTCENPDLITRCDPAPGCYPGCICEEGYVRDVDGTCKLLKDCSVQPECPANEEFSDCAVCQNTCDEPALATYCKQACSPGCVCNAGYLRTTDGSCVPVAECP